jgi:hypothetical protein
LPLVIVEIGVHDAPPALSAALLQACSASVPRGECKFDDAGDEAPVAIATVKWDGNAERGVHVEVGARRHGESAWLSKTLQFRAVDPRGERWRSVGLTIATLVRELVPFNEPGRSEGTAPSAATPASATPSTAGHATEATSDGPAGTATQGALAATGVVPPAPPVRDVPLVPDEDASRDRSPAVDTPPPGGDGTTRPGHAARTSFWMDIGALGGPAFREGSLRVGAFAAFGLHPRATPWFARLSLGHEVVPDGTAGLSGHFTTVSAGGGVALRWTEANLALEPHAALLVEQLGVTVTDATGRSDGGSQWAIGAHAGAALVWERAWVSPLVGLEGFWRGAPTDILNRNQVVATVPGLNVTLQVAIRLFL